jgi:1-acyl-sn-glycerol-3-phosphate acyltransferase
MIYTFLKFIVRLALKVYFRKIHIKGLEHIPKEGPIIIVSNHPSSFLDPISIALFVNQKISFLAKGSMFRNRIASKILTGLNMIPIYRAQDDASMLSKNNQVFKACYEKLSNNGTIMIFPEGTSEHERKLRPIKTGAARITLGAAKENRYNLNVKILPVGLNYTKSSKFRSELFIQFDAPLESDNYKEQHKLFEKKTVKKLTEDIELKIKNLIVDTDEYETLATKVESLYKHQIQNDLENNSSFLEIKISQEIVQGIKFYQKTDPVLFHEMKTKIDDYFLTLEEIGISDKSFHNGHNLSNLKFYSLKTFLILIFGFPIWLFGFINSFIPYKLPRLIALKISDSEAFYGALLMALGTVLFTMFYSLMTFLFWVIFQSPIITLIYALILPISGLFTIFYARNARKLYFNLRLYSRKHFVIELIKERKNLIAEFENLKSQYLKEL